MRTDNVYDDMRSAVQEARRTFQAADECAGSIADILRGRLRSGNVSGMVLTELKKRIKRLEYSHRQVGEKIVCTLA